MASDFWDGLPAAAEFGNLFHQIETIGPFTFTPDELSPAAIDALIECIESNDGRHIKPAEQIDPRVTRLRALRNLLI